jgi:hypothetical protein
MNCNRLPHALVILFYFIYRMLEIGSYDADAGRQPHGWSEAFTSKSLRIRGNPAQWELLHGAAGSSLRAGTYLRAVIDAYSFIRPSCPQSVSEAPVFAVANTVVVKVRGEVTRITCDQVTLIPYCEAWLVAALRCVDKTYDSMSCAGAGTVCAKIRRCMQAHARSPCVGYDKQLVDLLLEMHQLTVLGRTAPTPRQLHGSGRHSRLPCASYFTSENDIARSAPAQVTARIAPAAEYAPRHTYHREDEPSRRSGRNRATGAGQYYATQPRDTWCSDNAEQPWGRQAHREERYVAPRGRVDERRECDTASSWRGAGRK